MAVALHSYPHRPRRPLVGRMRERPGKETARLVRIVGKDDRPVAYYPLPVLWGDCPRWKRHSRHNLLSGADGAGTATHRQPRACHAVYLTIAGAVPVI